MPELNDLTAEEEKQFAQGQPRGFPFDPDFRMEDVMLPENDDMGIASEDDEVAEEEIETETGFGSVIGQLTAICSTCITASEKSAHIDTACAAILQLWTIFPRSHLKSRKSLLL